MHQRNTASRRRPSIFTKFVAAVLLLIAVLMLGIAVSGVRFFRASYEESKSAAQNDFANCYDNLNKFEERVVHLCSLLQSDEMLLTQVESIDQLSASQYQLATQQLLPKMYRMSDSAGEYFCRLYVNSSLDVLDATSRILPLETLEDEAWAQETISGWGNWRFLSPGEIGAKDPALVFPIRSLRDYTDLIALLRIDLDREALIEMLAAPRSQEYVTCYLQTEDGSTVVSTDPEAENYLFDAPEETLRGFEAVNMNSIQFGDDIVYYRSLPNSGWRLVMVLDNRALQDTLKQNLMMITFSGSALTLLGVLCALPILFSVVSRIRRFYRYVQSCSGTALQAVPPRLEPLGSDEIGQLVEAHNALLDRIRQMVRDRELQEEELRRLEISVLQEQINPHFLYNTLEATVWMAKLNQPEKVESTVRNLTRFYRLCLSKGSDVLPVEKELEIAGHYFAIQSMRYGDRFRLEIDVPEEIRALELPKITLQPLVENALMHGILESGKQEGTVRIFGRIRNRRRELCVADSGGHFTSEVWEAVMRGETALTSSSSGSGYGLRNVERRLCLFFETSRVMELDCSDPGETRIVIPFFSKVPEQTPDGSTA